MLAPPHRCGAFARWYLPAPVSETEQVSEAEPADSMLTLRTAAAGSRVAGASGGMADAHGSGPCVRKDVGVQLPPCPRAIEASGRVRSRLQADSVRQRTHSAQQQARYPCFSAAVIPRMP